VSNKAPGLLEEESLKEAGFSDQEIAQHRSDNKEYLLGAGFTKQEVMDYYGIREPDMAPSQDFIKRNLELWRNEQGLNKDQAGPPELPENLPKDAYKEDEKTFADNFWGGIQDSATGRLIRQTAPDKVHPDHAGRIANILHNAGLATGDAVLGVASYLAAAPAGAAAGGAAAGALAVVPGVGQALAAGGAALGAQAAGGAAAFAVPTALREYLVQQYEKGDVTSVADFMDRFYAIALAGSKSAVTGAVTTATGGAVRMGMAGASATTAGLTSLAAEAATMTTVGSALEGQMPEPEAFIENGLLMTGMHVGVKAGGTAVKYAPVIPGYAASKLRNIYAKTGVLPSEVAERGLDPGMRQEVLASNVEVPNNLVDNSPVKTGPIEVASDTQALAGQMEGGFKPSPETLFPTPEGTTLYHGTRHNYDVYDFSKSGGLQHLASPGAARDYARGAGGNRGRPATQDMYLKNYETGVVYELKDVVLGQNKEIKNGTWEPIGRLSESSEIVSRDTLPALTESEKVGFKPIDYNEFIDENVGSGGRLLEGAWDLEPKNQRVYPVDISGKKILDTKNKEGLKVFASLDKNAAGEVAYLIDNAKYALENDHPGQFSSNFWSATKYSKHRPLIGIIDQLKKLGYEGISFQDDMHATVALFEPTKKLPSEPTALPKPLSSKPSSLEESLDRVGKKIHSLYEVDTSLPLKQQAEQWWQNFHYSMLDKFDPLKRFVKAMKGGKDLSLDEDAGKLAQLSVAAGQKAQMDLEIGTFDFKDPTIKTGKSFNEVISPIQDKAEFVKYAVSKRALEIESQGKKSGFDPKDAQTIVDALDSKYSKHFQELVDYRNRTLQYLADSGAISQDLYKKLVEKNTAYVPFSRFFNEEGAIHGDSSLYNPIKALKGSERDIYNPLEIIARDTRLFKQIAERNRALVALSNLIESNPEQAELLGVKKVPGKVAPVKITEAEMAKFFEENNMTDLAESLDANSKKEVFTVFRGKYEPLKPNQFATMIDGKRTVYEASPLLAKSVQALTPAQQNILVRFMAPFARSLRAGATLTLEFAGANFARDQFHAAIMGKDGGYTPIKTWVEGVKSLWNHDASWQEALKSGVGDSATADFHRYMQSLSPDEFKATIGDRMLNGIKNPFQLMGTLWNTILTPLEKVSNIAEQGTRIGYYKKLGVLNPEMTAFEKAYMTRELTIDFQKSGAYGQAINMVSAFWNAKIQGVNQLAIAAKTDPVGVGARIFTYVTLPSILLWLKNKDDERWQNAPNWKKDSSLFIGAGKHAFWLPMPQEIYPIFGALPVRILEAASKQNPQAFKDFERTILSTFGGLIPIPTGSAPVLEHIFNKSFLTNAPVIPNSMTDVLPWAQYTQNTSATAIELGRAMSRLPIIGETSVASPMIIDNYIRGYTGGIGRYITQVIDVGLEKSGIAPEMIRPEKRWVDYPVIRAFAFRNPDSGVQPITDFYERSDVYKKYVGTAEKLKNTLRIDEYINFVSNPINQAKLRELRNIRSTVTGIGHQISSINYINTMTPAEKMQFQETLFNAMIQTAKTGNKLMDELEKVAKSKETQ